MEANDLVKIIEKRTGLKANELVCPREKSEMTPCVSRDGDLSMTDEKICVGCGASVIELLEKKQSKH